MIASPGARRHSRRAVIVTAVVALAIGTAAGWFLNSWAMSGKVSIDGGTFYSESVSISLPPQGQNSTSPASFPFHSYNFTLMLGEWYSPGGGHLYGTVHEPNGTSVPFILGGPPSASSLSGWITYIGPQGVFGVQWNDGASVNLLVAT